MGMGIAKLVRIAFLFAKPTHADHPTHPLSERNPLIHENPHCLVTARGRRPSEYASEVAGDIFYFFIF